MRPLPVIAALVIVVAAIGLVAWMSQPISSEPKRLYEPENPFAKELEAQAASHAQGHPKAVLTEGLHEFGEILLGETGEHTFVIRNDGDAVLKLEKGPIECKCTVPTLSQNEIPPGQTSEIVMTWKPEATTDEFVKSATIWTNDPDNPALRLQISGQVRSLVSIVPPEIWDVGTIKENEPTEFEGRIGSGFAEAFEIKELRASNDAIQIEAVPLTSEDLEESHFKSGYTIRCRLTPDFPVGQISESLAMLTDLPGAEEITVQIHGSRAGPFSILGQGWDGNKMTLRMGDINAAEGKEVTLSIYAPREEEPLEVISAQVKPDFLDVALKSDEKFNTPTMERHILTFGIPKNSPVGYFKDDSAAKVSIKTNRQSFAEINLNVEFTLQ